MKKINLILAGLVIFASGLYDLQAQSNSTIRLNTITERSKAAGSSATSWFYELNQEFSSTIASGDLMEIELPTETRTLTVERSSSYTEGTRSFVARETDGSGRYFAFTIQDEALIGLYHLDRGTDMQFGYDMDQKMSFMSSTPITESIACELDHKTEDPSIFPEISGMQKSSGSVNRFKAASNVNSMFSAVDDSITIDLMIPYTLAATQAVIRNRLFSIDVVIAQAMNLAQTALDNSETAIKLRLVHTYQTDYDETTDGVSSGTRLRRLTSSPSFTPSSWSDAAGFMNEVHGLRDEYGADFVSLFADVSDTGGIAWVLGSPNGFPQLGFSLNRVLQVSTGYTMVHELGHNMGSLHSRTQQSQAAGAKGGLFQYSVGFQNREDSVNTIMAYREGLNQLPVFSKEGGIFNNALIGSLSPFVPTDNSRSMREIKRVIAGYRNTTQEAPQVSLSRNSVEVQVLPGGQLNVPVEVTNQAGSDLMWEVDFDLPENGIAANSQRAKSSGVTQAEKTFSQAGLGKSTSLVNLGDSVFYTTSFEEEEGFPSGQSFIVSSWETFGSEPNLVISEENPANGLGHIRLENDATTEPITFNSPFFGPLPLGKYKAEFSFSLTGVDALNEIYELVFFDYSANRSTSGLRVQNGTITILGLGESGFETFSSTDAVINTDQYYTIGIVHNTDTQELDYYLDDQLIGSTDFLGAFAPEGFNVITLNSVADSRMDIDDFKMIRLALPFSYLKTDQVAGVVRSGESQTINLEIDASDLELGFYNSTLVFRSNDGTRDEIEIPLQIEVTEAVSNEDESDLPESISLLQNYPNPFNPTTEITYQLNESQDIRIEVFDIQGRKVETLFTGRQTSGEHTVSFNAAQLASGIYIYRLISPFNVISKKMVLIK